MNYSFISPALSELDEAAYYCEKQVEGLGGEFLREVDSQLIGFVLSLKLGEKFRALQTLPITALSIRHHLLIHRARFGYHLFGFSPKP